MTHTYSVRTWDMDLSAFTPQTEPWEGLSLWELKAKLRELREHGYACHRRGKDSGYWDNDTSVLVERDDEQTDGTR